eukprot:scaffold100790_cov30-Tisochrysis_lutea.AAC.6
MSQHRPQPQRIHSRTQLTKALRRHRRYSRAQGIYCIAPRSVTDAASRETRAQRRIERVSSVSGLG